MKKMIIALIGLGTVGSSVARILHNSSQRIFQRAGVEIVIKRAVVRDSKKYHGYNFLISEDINDILLDNEIDVVVELIGGIDYPFEIAKKVFSQEKAFVTANKAMLAYYAKDLLELSRGLPFGFEASVCGGIPVIEILRDSLVANEFFGFEGIFNGTSNYILSQMFQGKQSFDQALKSAQELGYAEADPSLDINGGDAGHKLLILAKLAYGIDAKPEDILIEGIEGIDWEDLHFADELGYAVKLLGIAKKEENDLDLRLHLALISKKQPLAQVNGVKNAINFQGDFVGDIFMSGFGAGGDATASAVVADLVHMARLRNVSSYPCPPFGFFDIGNAPSIRPKGKIISQYYLRFVVKDCQGILAQITSILADFGISVNEILQKSSGTEAKIFLITHTIEEEKILFALEKIQELNHLLQAPYKIRMQ